MIRSSLTDYRHELLLANFAGIPILQQHGSADDNVPAFHSRRLRQLISQYGHPSRYIELPGKGHWFDGVMTTTCLRRFYSEVLANPSTKPELPYCFDIVTANPADLGSRGGILIDQLISPGQLGKIEVERSSERSTWTLKTSNIFRFQFSSQYSENTVPRKILIDGYLLNMPPSARLDKISFLRSDEGSWKVDNIL